MQSENLHLDFDKLLDLDFDKLKEPRPRFPQIEITRNSFSSEFWRELLQAGSQQ